MTEDERARLEAIAESLARLERRQEQIERRLEHLERGPGAAGRGIDAGVGFDSARVSGPPAGAESPPGAPIPIPGPRPPTPGPPSGPRSLEAAFGLTWFSRIAVVTVVLALAFFFEYAFERRWITETGRTLIGVGCGLAALAFGERFWRSGQAAFGQALTAAGVAFLYLSFWAAFGLYHLFPQAAAFGLMVLTTALAGALALRYGAVAVAALGLAGGYATPLLLGGAQEAWFVLGYALLLDLGAAFAARAREWRWMEALALAGTVALYLSQFPVPDAMRWGYTLFVLAYYGLFGASRFLPVFCAAQLLAGIALAGMWAPSGGGLWLDGVVTAAGLAVAARRRWAAAVSASFAGFWIGYAAWRLPSGAGESPWAAWVPLSVSYLLFLAWPVWLAHSRRAALRLQDLAVAALNTAFYFGASYSLLRPHYGEWIGLFAVSVAVAQMAASRVLWRRDARGSLLAAGAAWVLLVLAAPIQFVGYRVTIAWALEAAAAVWIGARLEDTRAVRAAFAIFLLVLARLASVDGRMYPAPSGYVLLANARFLTFAVGAAGFWAAAWWIRRGRLALAASIGGHGVMLWGLCLEASAWAARAAAPQNMRSVASTSISVLAAMYAVLLVAAGVLRRHAPTRVLGVALIGAVVLKLYFYDIWFLGAFYRMAAFAILGALLWVMSYLYSRFRGSIGSWWRN